MVEKTKYSKIKIVIFRVPWICFKYKILAERPVEIFFFEKNRFVWTIE